MDKFESRRIALQALVASFGRGGIASVANAIEKDPSYVSRMLYPPGKQGRKRIGEDSVEILDAKFPGWLTHQASSRSDSEGLGTVVFARAPDIATYSAKKEAPKGKDTISAIVELLNSMSAEGLAVMLDKARDVAREYPARTTDDARFLTGNARIIEPRKPSPQAKRNKTGKT